MRARVSAVVGTVVIAVAVLAGCSSEPGPHDIVYPSLGQATPTTRPTATAQPVDPSLRPFCSAIAVPFLDLQLEVTAVIQRGTGPTAGSAQKAEVVERAVLPFAASTDPHIAAWIPAALAYLDQVQATASSEHAYVDLVSAVGQADEAVIMPIIEICSGQPGWE